MMAEVHEQRCDDTGPASGCRHGKECHGLTYAEDAGAVRFFN